MSASQEREVKYLPDAAAARAVWAVASQHLAPHADAPAFSYTRTTYFDTAERTFYRSRGRRLRVREYASAADADAAPLVSARCFVELKQSWGGVRSKTRLAVCADEVPAGLAALADGELTPQVASCYRRRSLVDATGALRLTLDEQLRFCRPRRLGSPFTAPGQHDQLALGPAFVLEYKAMGAPPAWLVAALAALPEAIELSKFVLGMEALVRVPDVSRRTLDRSLLQVTSCTG
jgi:hypothetical protein